MKSDDQDSKFFYFIIFKSLFSQVSPVVLQNLIFSLSQLDDEKIAKIASSIHLYNDKEKLELSFGFVEFINQTFRVMNEEMFEIDYKSSKIRKTTADIKFFYAWKLERYNPIFQEIISFFVAKAEQSLNENNEQYLTYIDRSWDLLEFITGKEEKEKTHALIKSVM